MVRGGSMKERNMTVVSLAASGYDGSKRRRTALESKGQTWKETKLSMQR